MKLPRHFLNHWLSAFEKSRVENHHMFRRFISRLENSLPNEKSPANVLPLEQKMGGGWRSSPDSRHTLWQIFKLSWQERLKLLRGLPQNGKSVIWLVADDRRSGVIEGWPALVDQLRLFGCQSAPSWLEKCEFEGRRLLCFTPNLNSLRTENFQGALHLSYLSLFAVPLAWPGTFLTAAIRMIISQPIGAMFRPNTLITSLLAASFDVLLGRQVPDRLLMLTSNSFVIELLRYMVMGSGKSGSVTEVLHGIPSLEIEAYHRRMIDYYPNLLADRLAFVPPVPNLDLDSINGQIRISTDIINLKMNAVSRQRDLLSLGKECVRRCSARNGIPAVTLNGAATVEGGDYQDTVCFAVEKAILRHVLMESMRLGISIHLQYSLHPAHIKSGNALAIRELLEAEGIEVIEDSFQTWLESILCISILSSASWDALAVGCDVVFGVSADDKIYSRGILSAFMHPTGQRDLFKVLSDAISRIPLCASPDPIERVSRVIGRNFNISV